MMEAGEEAASSSQRREIDQQLDTLLPLSPITDTESQETTILYELLDEVPNGRKLMNHLVSSASDLQLKEQDLSHGNLHKAASAVAGQWYEEERRASSQALPAALQLDAPVIFSWSKKAATAKSSTQKSKPHAVARETTNQTLFKSISARLADIAKREALQRGPVDEDGSRRSESSASRQRWASSQFHVDPLQEFVATALPRASKKENSEKKKVKRRSILNFWGGGTKRKEDRKTTKETEPSSTEQSHHTDATSIDEEAEPELGSRTQLSQNTLNLNSFIPLQPKKK